MSENPVTDAQVDTLIADVAELQKCVLKKHTRAILEGVYEEIQKTQRELTETKLKLDTALRSAESAQPVATYHMNAPAIAELIEAATEWDGAWQEYMLSAKPVTHDRLTKAEERIRAALAKLGGK